MNKTVLVTGSSRGIGKAIALYLARQGYELIIHCRSQIDLAEKVATEIRQTGSQARVLQFDLSNRQQCAQVLTQDLEQYGAYYAVICNAGIAADNAFPALTGEQWDSVIQTNLDGFYNVLKPLIIPMIRRQIGRASCRERV